MLSDNDSNSTISDNHIHTTICDTHNNSPVSDTDNDTANETTASDSPHLSVQLADTLSTNLNAAGGPLAALNLAVDGTLPTSSEGYTYYSNEGSGEGTIKLPPPTLLHFAYGCNLSLVQMLNRCPGATVANRGRLPGYRWLISSRGYANIVPSPSDEVWGLLYQIPSLSETPLSRHEILYNKETFDIECPDFGSNVVVKKAIVFLDPVNITSGTVAPEYANWMIPGIYHAVGKGLPVSYVEGTLAGPLGLDQGVLNMVKSITTPSGSKGKK
ncbi:hypothetical protein ABW21_db0206698 [Orbilia brochopaga]|nr:hypothetical protein ABW21_db0206698 [Drechslerella brochopaga]